MTEIDLIDELYQRGILDADTAYGYRQQWGGMRHYIRSVRDERIQRIQQDDATIDVIAARYDVSIKTVQRWKSSADIGK